MRSSAYSYALVVVQFAVLAGFAVTGPLLATHPAFLLLELAGLAIGVWAIAVMRIGRFNIIPDVREGAVLVMRGPYRYIRHPMYTSLLAGTAALVADDFSPLRCVMWLALAAVLLVKLRYEERLLMESFPAYDAYRKGTKRIIPGVW